MPEKVAKYVLMVVQFVYGLAYDLANGLLIFPLSRLSFVTRSSDHKQKTSTRFADGKRLVLQGAIYILEARATKKGQIVLALATSYQNTN